MRFTFRLRTLFVLATLIAVGLFLWGERQRFLREHVDVRIVEEATGTQLTHFRYRTWIITQQSGLNPEWSEWIEHRSDTALSLKVPQHCRLNLQAQDAANPVQEGRQAYESMLVAPESTHQWTIRLKPSIKEIPTGEDNWYSPSDFTNGPCILSGRVVDKQGNAVSKFGVRVFLQFSYQESYLFEFEEPEGRFNLNCPQPIAGYIVEADSFALEQRGFLERTELAMPDTANQTVVLMRGLRISGTLKQTKEHRKETTLVLIDRRTDTMLFHWKTLDEHERDWSQNVFDQPKSFPSIGYLYQYRKQLSSTSDFEFTNLPSGLYLLLAFYNDQLVTKEPIVVGSEDVAIKTIVVPPTGSVQGVVKEWDSILMPVESPPFESSSVNPFELYELSRMNSPSRKLFRVDHLGRFHLDDILVGQYSINLYPPRFQSWNRVITHPFLVLEGKTKEVDCEFTPILDLEIRNEEDSVRNRFDNQRIQAELLGSDGVRTIAWLGNPEETRNGPRRRLYGDKSLPTGQYKIQIPNGYSRGNLQTQFDYIKTDRTQAKEVSAHELSFTAPPMVHFVSEQLTCIISHKGVVVFERELSVTSPMECIVEGAGPFDILLENTSHGWFLFRDVKFSRFQVELGDVQWNEGGTIELDISSTHFAVEPIRFELRNELTGKCYTGDEQEQSWMREKKAFEGLMPGTWVFELFARDSVVGEKLLLSKKIELKADETILFDGNSILPH